jgi:hypothetical protein
MPSAPLRRVRGAGHRAYPEGLAEAAYPPVLSQDAVVDGGRVPWTANGRGLLRGANGAGKIAVMVVADA